MNGSIQYVAFGVWLLSRSIVFVGCIALHDFLWLNSILLYRYTGYVYSFIF